MRVCAPASGAIHLDTSPRLRRLVGRRLLGAATVLLLALFGGSACAQVVEPTDATSESSDVISDYLAEPNLLPTEAELRPQCQAAADVLGIVIPCPTLLPPTTSPARCIASFAPIDPNDGCAQGAGFFLSPTVAPHTGLFHLIIEASPVPTDDCGETDAHQVVEIGAERALLIECSEFAGLLADHSLVRWTVDGVTVDVSLHGHSDQDKAAVVAIARGIDLLYPSGS